MANLTWGAIRTSGAMLSWLFSGHFTRFPNLKVALSEGEIGWMPYFLERAEQVLDTQRHWVKKGQAFMNHATTDVDLDEIGVGNVMCETDYPHSDSTWPDCLEVAREQIAHLPVDDQYAILRGNAARLYRFTPATPPVLAKA